MYQETLQEAGLSVNEAKVYEAVLKSSEASVQDLSLLSGVHRRNTYDALAKLVEKGLASEVFISGEKRFKAIDPLRLLEILREKETKIESILPALQASLAQLEENEEAYIYRGIEGFKTYFQNIIETGETVYFIGAKAFWLDPRLQHALVRFQRERKKRGITFMHLFDHEVKRQRPDILKTVGKPYRFLPKDYSSQTAVDIFGSYVVTFVGLEPGKLPANPVMFVMKSRRLADGYRKFFNFMWDRCGNSQ